MDEMQEPTAGPAAATPEMQELFDLAVARVMETLATSGEDLDRALRADPVRATVEFGTDAVHVIAMSAESAGKPIPFEILIQVGIQTIKELGSIANDKGYLPDEEIEVFLKEAFQQSLAKYTKLDMQAGKIKPEDMQAVQAKLAGQMPAAPAGGPPLERATPATGALARAAA